MHSGQCRHHAGMSAGSSSYARAHLSVRLTMALWLAALLWCSSAAAVKPGTGTAKITSSRADAFIGYQEHAAAECKDRLPHECQLQASQAGCLADPFTMRAMCQLSCGTGACRDQRQAHRRRMHGRATPYGTWTYAKAFRSAVARNHFTELDLLNTHKSNSTLLLSSLGTGTYLGIADASTDEAVVCAVMHSVMHGWNVIDTASNYRGGHAEAAVGQALDSLLVGSSAREFSQPLAPAVDSTAAPVAGADAQAGNLYSAQPQSNWHSDEKGTHAWDVHNAVSSKEFYSSDGTTSSDGSTGSTGSATANGGSVGVSDIALLRVQRAKLSADVAAMAPDITRDMLFISTKAGFVADGERKALLAAGEVRSGDFVSGHCMHPECLRASLLQSLGRLGREMVDVLYVHNPAEAQLAQVGRPVFMERLKAAFVALEALRQAGLLAVYGLATWDCFRVPPTSKLYVSLEDVVALAEEAGGRSHGFRAVQLPINAAMPEAWAQPWQRSSGEGGQTGQTLMETAQKLGVRVFASGPLMEGELLSKPALQLDAIPSLATLPSTGAKLLQLARSTPGLTSAVVGHKRREHVEANHEVSMELRLAAKRFRLVHEEVARALELGGESSVQH